MIRTIEDMPTLMQLFRDGLGESMASSLLEAARRYVIATNMMHDTLTQDDSNNIDNLILLHKALIKDIYGINL